MVSIIIPVYNTSSELLKYSVGSALAQTLEDVEIVIVDDGSVKEDTLQYLHELEAQAMSQVSIIHVKNVGPSSARWIGIQHARGEYVVFLDGDDMLHELCCERLLKLIESEASDLAEVKGKVVYDLKNVNNRETIGDGTVTVIEGRDRLMEQFVRSCELPIGWNIWAKIYKRDIFLKRYTVRPELHRGQELPAIAEYLSGCSRMVYREEELYYYNKGNEQSATRQRTYITLTVAKSWDAVYQVCEKQGYCDLLELLGKIVCENIIGVVAGAGHNHASGQIPEYSALLRKYRKYITALDHVNKVKMLIIMYAPGIYVRKARREEKKG